VSLALGKVLDAKTTASLLSGELSPSEVQARMSELIGRKFQPEQFGPALLAYQILEAQSRYRLTPEQITRRALAYEPLHFFRGDRLVRPFTGQAESVAVLPDNGHLESGGVYRIDGDLSQFHDGAKLQGLDPRSLQETSRPMKMGRDVGAWTPIVNMGNSIPQGLESLARDPIGTAASAVRASLASLVATPKVLARRKYHVELDPEMREMSPGERDAHDNTVLLGTLGTLAAATTVVGIGKAAASSGTTQLPILSTTGRALATAGASGAAPASYLPMLTVPDSTALGPITHSSGMAVPASSAPVLGGDAALAVGEAPSIAQSLGIGTTTSNQDVDQIIKDSEKALRAGSSVEIIGAHGVGKSERVAAAIIERLKRDPNLIVANPPGLKPTQLLYYLADKLGVAEHDAIKRDEESATLALDEAIAKTGKRVVLIPDELAYLGQGNALTEMLERLGKIPGISILTTRPTSSRTELPGTNVHRVHVWPPPVAELRDYLISLYDGNVAPNVVDDAVQFARLPRQTLTILRDWPGSGGIERQKKNLAEDQGSLPFSTLRRHYDEGERANIMGMVSRIANEEDSPEFRQALSQADLALYRKTLLLFGDYMTITPNGSVRFIPMYSEFARMGVSNW